MKRYQLLLTLLFFSCQAQAQGYKSIFGHNSTEWIIASTFCTWQDGIDTFYIKKDTIVNGFSYKIVSEKTSSDNIGLLREDTISGKVWYKSLVISPIPSDTVEVVAFDFSLEKGDSFDVTHQNYRFFNVVAETDSLRIVDTVYYQNGLKHIQFKYAANASPKEPLVLIEGIGCNIGIMWKQYQYCRLVHYLLCSYKDGIKTTYTNKANNGNCDYLNISHLNNNHIEDIKIYPNPAVSIIHIEDKHYEVNHLQIADPSGKTYREFSGNISRDVDVSDMPDGFYLVTVKTKAGTITHQKLIIQH